MQIATPKQKALPMLKPVKWPSDDLEEVGPCPSCGGEGDILFQLLEDIVFKCAPGHWEIKCCRNCKSGFLDPRPTEQSISRAYDVYYTHGENQANLESTILPRAGLLTKAVNGRLNLIYGVNRAPASRVLGRLLTLVPFVQSVFDPLGRSLHRPPHVGATLLDFGCGDGRFLAFAREMGWNVMGVDFDQKAVATAQSLGLDVRCGGFEVLDANHKYDAITMSHVIEHIIIR